MKINLLAFEKELVSFGQCLFSSILFEKINLNIKSRHKYEGVEILIKEVGKKNNIVCVSIHKPSQFEKHQCHIKAYECEKNDTQTHGCKIITFNGKKYLCSVTGMLPGENDLMAICCLAKTLNIKTVVAFEKELPKNNSLFARILRKVA